MKNNIMPTKINRIKIDNYKKVFSKIEKDTFLNEKTKITGLVSFIKQDIIRYYDDFKIHKFVLSIWESSNAETLIEKELIIYRAVSWDENDEYLLDIIPLSIINLDVYLDTKSKSAIFNSGEILQKNYSNKFNDYKQTFENISQLFGEIEYDYGNKYKSEITKDEKSTAFNFETSVNISISHLVVKAYHIVSSVEDLQVILEKCAFTELFELTQKGWFQEDNFTEKDFLTKFRKGHLLHLSFNETSYSIWYENKELFGHRIIFSGNYEHGIQETSLFVQMGPTCAYDKNYLLNKKRETIKITNFGKLKLDEGNLFYDGKVKWLDKIINISFDTGSNKKINEKTLQTAENIFKNQSEWEDKAYKYAIDNFLTSKNEDWLNDDQSPLSAEKFKHLLGDFSILFEQEDTFTFSFETHNDLFSGHSVYVTGTTKEGFIDSGF